MLCLGSADSKGVMGVFFGSAGNKGVTRERWVDLGVAVGSAREKSSKHDK